MGFRWDCGKGQGMGADSRPSSGDVLKALEDIQRRLSQLEQTIHRIEAQASSAKPAEPPATKQVHAPAPPPPAEVPVLKPAAKQPPPPARSVPAPPKPTPPPFKPSPTPAQGTGKPAPAPTPAEAKPAAASVGEGQGDWSAAVRKLHDWAEAAPTPAPPQPPAKPAAKPAEAAAGPPIIRERPAPKSAPKPQAGKIRQSIEQRLGTWVMLFVGVAVLLLAAVFFFKFAIEKGWISKPLRLLAGAAVGFVMIGIGEWSLIKRQLKLFAAGIMGGGVVLLYFVVFVASPNGWYSLISAPWSFGLMCVVTALGMVLSVQTRMLSTALVALIGALATPVLLSTGENRQVLLMCYMLVVDAGFLSLGLGMRWPVLAPLALAGTAGLFGGWYAQHFAPGAWPRTVGFAWAFLGEFVAYLAAGIRTRRLGLDGAKIMLLLVVAVFTVLLLVLHPAMSGPAFLACVGAVAALGLAGCATQKWEGTCILVMLCPLAAMGFHAKLGRCEPMGMMILLAGVTAAMLAVAAWRRWQSLAIMAAGQAVCIVGLWTQHNYQPANWAVLDAFTWVLLGEFFIYVCAAMRWDRIDEQAAQGILIVAGSAAVVLWSCLIDSVSTTALYVNVLPLMLITLAICTWKHFPVLRATALGQAVLITGVWAAFQYSPADWTALDVFTWLLLGEFIVYACAAMRWDRIDEQAAQGILIVAGLAAVVLWVYLISSVSMTALYVNVLPLMLITLAICTWKSFAVLRVVAVGQAVLITGVWVAHRYSPADWTVMNVFTWLLLGEFLVYICAALRLRRIDDISAQGILIVAGSAAVVLWSCLIDSVSTTALYVNVLPLMLITLAICTWKSFPVLRVVALGQALLITGVWVAHRYSPADWTALNVFAWLLLGEFIVYTCAAMRIRRIDDISAQGILIVVGSAAVVLWVYLIESASMNAMLATVGGLVVVTLAICTWKDFSVLRVAVLLWSAGAVFFQFAYRWSSGDMALADRWGLSAWAWIFFGLLTAQMLVRAFLKPRPMNQPVYAWASTAAMAGMFGLTYGLLRAVGEDWMGAYTAALGAAAIVTAVLVRRRAERRTLAYALLGQGLVLLVLAVPIQFHKANIPLAWSIQGVVVMFLARRLRSLPLLIMAPMVLALALMHFFGYQLPMDPLMGKTALVAFGAPVTWGLLLAAAIAAGMLAAGGILRAGEPLLSDQAERALAIALVLAATVFWAGRAGLELPVTGAMWAWLVLAAGLAATAIAARSEWLGIIGAAALLISAGKWAFFDTIAMRVAYGAATNITPLLNWQFAAGIVVLAALPVHVALLARRVPHAWQLGSAELAPEVLGVVAGMICSVGVLYAVSFEIDRYFASPAGRVWQDPHQAMHTAYSVWWAIFATVMMAIGFIRRRRAPRILSMIVFAGTLAKVFLVDMRNVEAVYRILSFMCLGTLLIAASWLYHRYFRRLLAVGASPVGEATTTDPARPSE